MRLCFTLFVLLFTQLFFNLAHAAPSAGVNAEQRKSLANAARIDDRRKRKQVKLVKKSKVHSVADNIGARGHKSATPVAAVAIKKIRPSKSSRIARITPPRKGYKKGYGRQRIKPLALPERLSSDAPMKMSASHKKRYQHAKLTAMNKLMSQMGKPYRWGGMSPTTGFDCSGLIYYAYKDVMRIPMPRTANEMYHFREAAPVKKGELESGDLVFFRIANRGAADHVGVYLGNGRFIQSPRTGRDIRISYLSEDYWQDHYVGARRVMTPKNIR
ncbi:C40 family peptidase [Biostraticola tofi]|uniref:Murein DD-endopeptidase n=1 Tax=Biostraticola tofi TaxID=466109 RepID=A0A4R3Z3W8_9GAMM|nr:C40 family peptidase [Biostraticola tofi]TCV99748.1 murein DD-endopeptidase [Biostraticola tofi]